MSWCWDVHFVIENRTTQKNNCNIARIIVEQVVVRNLGSDLVLLQLGADGGIRAVVVRG